MTQPVQEPTTQRSISVGGWGQRQLERRPAPTGGCPCPIESGVAYNSTVDGTSSVNNNSLTTISFDYVTVSAGATAIAIATAPSPGTTQPFNLLEPGWFMFQFSFNWATLPGQTLYRVDPDFPLENMSNSVADAEGQHTWSRSLDYTYGPMYNYDYGDNTLIFQTQQISGGSVNITAVYFTVIYLGPDLDPTQFPFPPP